MAVGALRALRHVGLRVPAGLSVVGFDDHPMAQYFDLTTIAQDVRDRGRQIAANTVDAVVRPGEVPPVVLHAPTRLVMRSATGCPRAGVATAPPAGGYSGDDSWMFGRAMSGNWSVPCTQKGRRCTAVKLTIERGISK